MRKIRGKQVALAKERLEKRRAEHFENNPQSPKQAQRNSSNGYKRPGRLR